HVEKATAVADRTMLFQRAPIGHRHLPAGEVDQTCAERRVPIVQGRPLRRHHAARAATAHSAAVTVFARSSATVIGPTPPGTGVIARARSRAAAKSTSPQSLPAALRFMPTSITTAPRRIHSPRTS